MSTAAERHARIVKDTEGLATYAAISGKVTGGAVIQALIDIIEPESTQTHRGHLDQMSTVAHRQLLAELIAVKAMINTWEAAD